MEYVLLVLTVIMAATKAVLNKKVKNGTETLYQTFRFNLFCFVFAFITVFIVGIRELDTLLNTPILLALGLAVCTIGMQIFSMKAVQLGPVSVSSLFCYCGFIIPTVFGCVYYKEPFRVLQGVGIAMIVFAFIFSTKGGEDKKPNAKWLFCSISALLSSGLIGVFQKIFMREYPDSSLNNFLIFSFLMILAIGGVYLLVMKLVQTTRRTIPSDDIPARAQIAERPILDKKKQLFFAVVSFFIFFSKRKTVHFVKKRIPRVLKRPVFLL